MLLSRLLLIPLLATTPLLAASPAVATDFVATASGDWDDAATWGDEGPPLAVGSSDSVSIPAGVTVTIPAGAEVFVGASSVVIGGTLNNDGRFEGDGSNDIRNLGTVVNNATMLLYGGSFDGSFGRALFVNDGAFENHGDVTVGPFSDFVSGGDLENRGTIDVQVRGELHNRGTLDNHGTIESDAPTTPAVTAGRIRNTRGTIVNHSGATLRPAAAIGNNGDWRVALIDNRGTIELRFLGSIRGAIVNHGALARIENRGVIRVDNKLTNTDSRQEILNHDGGRIEIGERGIFDNGRATLNNLIKGLVRIRAGGELLNGPGGVINNDGGIQNDGALTNNGVLRNLCRGVVNGNPVDGFAPVNGCDVTPPEITVPQDITAEATGPSGASVSYSVTITDDLDPAPTLSCTPASGSIFGLGSTTVVCDGADEAGNTASAQFLVSVVDTTPPVITVLGMANISLIVGEGYFDEGATAADVVDGDLSAEVIVTNSVDVTVAGSYQVVYEVRDVAGNAAVEARDVHVISVAVALERLIDDVLSAGLVARVQARLIGPLAVATRRLSDASPANDVAACNVLGVFQRRVRGYTPRWISAELAAELSAAAERVADAAGCR